MRFTEENIILKLYFWLQIRKKREAISNVSFVEDSYFNFNQKGLKKRSILKDYKIVENEDLGVVKTSKFVHYGTVEVNDSNCTLCMSCVEF
ncbi:MAG: hypothetical protein R2837_04910 [Aliarcobacter sp.]